MAAILNLKNAVVMFLSVVIVFTGMMIGPGGQVLNPLLPQAVSGGVSTAEAHRTCKNRSHTHYIPRGPAGGHMADRWWVWLMTPAGGHMGGSHYRHWKSKLNGFPVFKEGKVLCV